MKNTIQKTIFWWFRRMISACVLMSFLMLELVSPVYAQSSEFFPQPGTMVLTTSDYQPVLMKAVKVFPQDPFKFDFIIDRGTKGYSADELKAESERLVKYFLTSLTIPEKDMWVNLSPYEHDRIIADGFGATEMGREVLLQDYILKQLAASLIHPDQESGQKFWEKVYERAYQMFGETDIPLETFHKVWIVPKVSSVYENADTNTTFVVETSLDVMLEEDYVALDHAKVAQETYDVNHVNDNDEANKLSSEVMRDVVIPLIRDEVNNGEHFAPLRQIMHSLVLATWYKQALKKSILSQGYVDQQKINGVKTDDVNAKETIYNNYVEAFKKGVFDFIKEEYDPVSQSIIPKKYFSGGVTVLGLTKNLAMLDASDPKVAEVLSDFGQLVEGADDQGSQRLFLANGAGSLADAGSLSPSAAEKVSAAQALTGADQKEQLNSNLNQNSYLGGLENHYGILSVHAQRLSDLSREKNWIIAVRTGNVREKHLKNPNMISKPYGLYYNTMFVGESAGLVVDQTHPAIKRAWKTAMEKADAAYRRAEKEYFDLKERLGGQSDLHSRVAFNEMNLKKAELVELQRQREKALDNWNNPEYSMPDNYEVNPQTGVLEYVERDAVGNEIKRWIGIHGDYDLESVFQKNSDGSLTKISFGTGDARDDVNLKFRPDYLNRIISPEKKMFRHGANVDQKKGKKVRPPAVVFYPDGTHEYFGNEKRMKWFYVRKLGVKWEYPEQKSRNRIEELKAEGRRLRNKLRGVKEYVSSMAVLKALMQPREVGNIKPLSPQTWALIEKLQQPNRIQRFRRLMQNTKMSYQLYVPETPRMTVISSLRAVAASLVIAVLLSFLSVKTSAAGVSTNERAPADISASVQGAIGYNRSVAGMEVLSNPPEGPAVDPAMVAPNPELQSKVDAAGQDSYGGIDLEKVDVNIKKSGNGVTTAFDDPAQLEKLRQANGLNPVVYDVKPLTLSMLTQVFGALPQ